MVKKKGSTKKKMLHKSSTSQTTGEVKIEKILIENFVALQKVMTNLSVKFDGLTHQISKLLDLFEISAKSLAEKGFNPEGGIKENKKIIDKLDNLSEQNKLLARGFSLMHSKDSNNSSYNKQTRFYPQQNNPPSQNLNQREVLRPTSENEYQDSISQEYQPQEER